MLRTVMDAAEGKLLAPHMGQSRPSRDFAQGSEVPHRFPDWDLAKLMMSGMKTQTTAMLLVELRIY